MNLHLLAKTIKHRSHRQQYHHVANRMLGNMEFQGHARPAYAYSMFSITISSINAPFNGRAHGLSALLKWLVLCQRIAEEQIYVFTIKEQTRAHRRSIVDNLLFSISVIRSESSMYAQSTMYCVLYTIYDIRYTIYYILIYTILNSLLDDSS